MTSPSIEEHFSDLRGYVEGNWASDPSGSPAPSPVGDYTWDDTGAPLPSAIANGSVLNFGGGGAAWARTVAWAQVTGLPTCIPSTVEIWVVADHDENADFPAARSDCDCADYDDSAGDGEACDACGYDSFGDPYGCGTDGLDPTCVGLNGADLRFVTFGDGEFGRRVWGRIASAVVGVDEGETRRYRVGGLLTAPLAWGATPHYSIQGQINDMDIGYRVTDGAAVVFGAFECCAGEVPPDEPPGIPMDVVEWFEA
jgi:hypothetical protein